MSRWMIVMSVVCVACGSESTATSPPTSEAPPTSAAVGACDLPSLSTCTQYGAGTPDVRALAQSACEQQHGHFVSGACPTANVVASCAANTAGDVTRYYSSGGTPYTAESGQAACAATAAPGRSTTTLSAPAADAPTLQEWCDTPSAWICDHCRDGQAHDACVTAESGACLAVGYPATTRLSRPRSALDRCVTDVQAGCGPRPSSCRPPPVAPGAGLTSTQACLEDAAVMCERCDHDAWAADADACMRARCDGDLGNAWPGGTLGDLERILEQARARACPSTPAAPPPDPGSVRSS